jgi:cob(I)alamin adenosyltransferase
LINYRFDDIVINRGNIMKTSYVQVYTGGGKGKTTAAVGLAARAAGQGLSVKFVQFLKGRETGEIAALKSMGNIEILRVSKSSKFFGELSEREKEEMRGEAISALTVIERWLNDADLIVLDEALGALHCGIIKKEELLRLIEARGGTEIVLTGRNAPKEIIECAHLVTEMKEIKHYYNEGAPARRGIEY